MDTCYRHPNRETGVSCSSCWAADLPRVHAPTPVGMRCPECANQRTQVRRGPAAFEQTGFRGDLRPDRAQRRRLPGRDRNRHRRAQRNRRFGDRKLRPPGHAVADGEWYRFLTGGFLHAGLLHIGFNMFALFILGRLLEPAIGTPRFVALYFASLFAGSFGAIALTNPFEPTVGASGAIFGLFAAAFVIARGRGLNALASELGVILLHQPRPYLRHRRDQHRRPPRRPGRRPVCAMFIVAGERGNLGSNPFPAEILGMAAVAVFSIAAAITVA